MNSANAALLFTTLDRTFADINSLAGVSTLGDSYFAQFLVVYISGIYEEAIENILVDFATRHSARREIVAYVKESINRSFRNPDSAKIIEIADLLGNSTWVACLKGMANEKIALDNIIRQKNNIAHGLGSTITLSEVSAYFADSRKFIEEFDKLLT